VKLIAFDWDGKSIWVNEDGLFDEDGQARNTRRLGTQFDLLDELRQRDDGPFLVVCEAPFESYAVDRRQRTIDEYAEAGFDLRTINPRQTAWWRIEREIEKGNENDAAAIFNIAKHALDHGHLLHVPAPALTEDDPWVQLRKRAERELMVLRRSGRKELLWKGLVQELPKFKELTSEQQRALGGSGGYSKAILPAVYVAARHTTDIRQWERLMGLYSSGKPSLFRSDIFHHGWQGNKNASRRRDSGLTLSQYRRNLRWLYRQVKDLEVVA